MSLSRRYHACPPGESARIGIDFSALLPPGVTLSSAALTVFCNTNPVQPAPEWTVGVPEFLGRMAWCQVSGGMEGTDYQFRWSVSDNNGNTWQRVALMLSAQTS